MEDFALSMEIYDFIVVGAGTAGLPCAIFGAKAGARVLVVEKESQIGGTLHVSGGHMSAAGTKRQKERGIQDSTEAHFKDIQRISNHTVRSLPFSRRRPAPSGTSWRSLGPSPA